ncbi:unnamed protein product [Ilex paraguariensis]|uniref:CCHC-type domain-containing protein n=1 Tax=Ilex paraguariensis TaxID=185542 RepID=A0ABC8U4M2_9AQUA
MEDASLILVNSILGRCECPWSYLDIVRQVKGILSSLEFCLVHVYREANYVVDRLAGNVVRNRRLAGYVVMISKEAGWICCYGQQGLPVLCKYKLMVFNQEGEVLKALQYGPHIYNRKGCLTKVCPEKDAAEDQSLDICLRCGNSGHNMFSCNSNEYSFDDLRVLTFA